MTAEHVQLRWEFGKTNGPGEAGVAVQTDLFQQGKSCPYHNYQEGSEITNTVRKDTVVAQEIEYSRCTVCMQGI